LAIEADSASSRLTQPLRVSMVICSAIHTQPSALPPDIALQETVVSLAVTQCAISGYRAHELQMKKTEAGNKQPWTLCSRLIQINSERRSTAV
jgi:hypothetical protein